ncbi:hypothetical protein MMYC01_209650 [Madurella mycetomatis]|uniref:Uncharacterized protein n=1 Tax=Madurella mycetomatis TaxID=100816 RepID=A0A175VQW1_9PEZI|nr:hypothetical protein MMYC01_209650 [Madurella mycetomatis]
METSAPKRRRTSPRSAISIQSDQESTTPRDLPPPRPSVSPSRPSFASPTRASLGRFNPEILRRRESQTRRSRPSPDAAPSASRAATPDSAGSLAKALRTRLELRSAAKDSGTQPASEEDGTLRSPARRLGTAHVPTRPTPRPLPPPPSDDDEDITNPFIGRGLRRSDLGVLPEVVVPQPELPPTPEHPDPVVSTPPSGIHNTPSRRPRRNKPLAGNIKSSSPLKQPPLRPPGLPQKGSQPEFSVPADKAQEAARSAPTTAELRGLKPVDSDADKKKLRDSLLAEVGQLERDLDIASKENERIRQARLAKRDAPPPANKDELLDVLRRHVLPPEERNPDPEPATDWLTASALNPIAFLPFSKPGQPLPTLQPPTLPSKDDVPPISHHPLPMSASESLPYLRVFSPLTFTSAVSPLPKAAADTGPLLQHHAISATSTPPGLFAARIEMTVNTKTLAVAELSVPRLDPNAAAELRPFVQRIVGGQQDARQQPGVMHHNVSILCWGMGEWLRVAVQRAKVWGVLEGELEEKEGLSGMVARLRERKEKAVRQGWRRGKRKRGRDDGDPGGDDDEVRYEAGDLLPFIGRTAMDFEIPVLDGGNERPTLRVQWRIRLDWTGEARSEIGVLVGLPAKWHKCDERGQLSNISGLFDELIQAGEDPLDAVRTVVSLLAGEQKV